MTDRVPLVSIVTVNLNGERYLEDLLSSLEAQSYLRTEILLVDNGSTDGSVATVRRRFPEVRVIEVGKNLGFTGGNNLGFQRARGEYIALINNDTVVEPDWLRHLVEEAEADPEVGGVGSKILFARPFVAVTLALSRSGAPSIPGEASSVRLFLGEASRFRDCSYHKPIAAEGFGRPELVEGERGRGVEETATVYLPVEADPGSAPGSESHLLVLRLRASERSGPPPVAVDVRVAGTLVTALEVGAGWLDYPVEVPRRRVQENRFEVINNAGSFLEPNGRAGDRGIFEPDCGQFDTAEDVTALCGCSMLLRRSVLDRVGFFDRDLFMYYEDTELSWRIRKAGYRLRYQPASRVHHFHASTSGEDSPFFQFLVARNRILMLLRHGPLRYGIRAYLEEVYRCLRLGVSQRIPWREPLRTRLRIQASLLWRAPRACLKRWGLLRP